MKGKFTLFYIYPIGEFRLPFVTSMVGVVLSAIHVSRQSIGVVKIFSKKNPETYTIDKGARRQLNGHTSKVFWLTGLSGSGKSRLANAFAQELHAKGMRTYVLDGDNVRMGLNQGLGFTDTDRGENIRRVAEVAKLMVDAGIFVLTALISPFSTERALARSLFEKGEFIEIFVDTHLVVCEAHDAKGLYKKARSGDLPNFTGISSRYETPLNPDLILDNSLTIEQKVEMLSNFI